MVKKVLAHRAIILAWLAACLILFGRLGSAPITDIDEGAFSEATREMLARGDFVSPWLLDAPRFDKPVLIHWLQMASMSIFGVTTLGARLPSAIAGLIWLASIAALARAVSKSLWPQQDASKAYFWGLIIACTTIGIPLISRAATADALLNAFLALSLWCLWNYFYSNEQVGRKTVSANTWQRLAAVCVGLGLLTKGPIAFLIPGAASFFAGLSGAFSGTLGVTFIKWVRLVANPVNWLIALAICAPWYWLQYQAQGMAFIQGFFGVHNVGRFTSTMHGFSAGPWYYPTWILIATLPWAPLVIRTLFAGARTGLAWRKELVMLWGIFFFVVVFFSFSATKLPHYGFYGLSGLVVVMAIAATKVLADLQTTASQNSLQRGLLAERGFLAIVLLGLMLLPQWWPRLGLTIGDAYYQAVWGAAADQFASNSWWFVLLAPVAIYAFFARPGRGLALGAITFAVAIHVMIVPTVVQAFRGPIQAAAEEITKHQWEPVITWRLASPTLAFYAKRVIKPGEPSRGSTVVMHVKDVPALAKFLTDKNNQAKEGNAKAAAQFADHAIDLIWEKNGIGIVQIR